MRGKPVADGRRSSLSKAPPYTKTRAASAVLSILGVLSRGRRRLRSTGPSPEEGPATASRQSSSAVDRGAMYRETLAGESFRRAIVTRLHSLLLLTVRETLAVRLRHRREHNRFPPVRPDDPHRFVQPDWAASV